MDEYFICSLAKVVIAIAWADDELAHEEVNALKDLIFQLDGISERGWKELEMYMVKPVGADERERLITNLLEETKTAEQKATIISTIQTLIEADENIDSAEKEAMSLLKEAVEDHSTGFGRIISKLLGGSIAKRRQKFDDAPNRDVLFDDYVHNNVYFHVKHDKKQLHVKDDKELYFICSLAALMGYVAKCDLHASENEATAIIKILKDDWELHPDDAQYLAEIVTTANVENWDRFRYTRHFFDQTTREQRLKFVDSLFSIANSCGGTSTEEIESIRSLSNFLKLSNKEFITAKLKISREDRNGL
ncbi:MAG: TerB family tellurite resistance protein [Lentisphaeria bacterium]|nr:TerB family tellurite resistance protein [Lentisphaeria bacterium]NQZ66489.1 TerB family tellurite resistance protein [Lentisphaeria bacterium]